MSYYYDDASSSPKTGGVTLKSLLPGTTERRGVTIGSGAGRRRSGRHELPLADYGLQLLDFTDVETRLPMDLDVYLRYALSETNVENSIATGACSHREARDWCLTTLEPVFADGPLTVVIPGHVATLARAGQS